MGALKLAYCQEYSEISHKSHLKIVHSNLDTPKSSKSYSPFGMKMPGRYGNDGDKYKYGFNGMEKDNELYNNEGSSYDLGERHYDPRTARMKSIDPRESEYPWQSSYVYHRNSPISMIDYLGGGDPPLSFSASFNLNARYTIGSGKGTSHMSLGIGMSASATYSTGNFSMMGSLNASALVTDGGMTMPFGKRQDRAYSEFTLSPGITVGGKLGSSISQNYLAGNATTSLNNPIVNSATYTLNFHMNSEGRSQRTGTFGARFNKVSFNILEDVKYWPGADGEDRWYTGTGNVSFHGGEKFGTLTFGNDTYTGNSINSGDTPEELGDTERGGMHMNKEFYWANQYQLDKSMGKSKGYNQSLNNASSFLRYTSSNGFTATLSNSGPKHFGSQNFIHGMFTPHFHLFKPSTSNHQTQISGGFGLSGTR